MEIHTTIEVMWIQGHIRINGNEIADLAADLIDDENILYSNY